VSLILDTGAIYAFYDSSDTWHGRVKVLFEQEPGLLHLPTLVIAETDYLLGKRLGEQARLAFLEDVVAGFYAPAELSTSAFVQILEINQKHATLELGATDASVIVIAQTLGVSQIATIDRRHFVPLARMFELELLP
jgi:uncharacterized protein